MAKRKKRKKNKKKRNKVKKRKSSKKIKKVNKKSSKETRDSDGNLILKVSETWAKQAYVNKSQYEKKYKLSIKDNENFWAK